MPILESDYWVCYVCGIAFMKAFDPDRQCCSKCWSVIRNDVWSKLSLDIKY
jgi:hypothetical protein